MPPLKIAENCPPDTGLGLSARQLRAIEGLVAGQSATQVAEQVGISRRQLYNWMHNNEKFVAEWRRCRIEFRRAICANLEILAAISVQVLRRTLTGRKSSPAEKLRAVISILHLTARDRDPAAIGPDDPEGILLEFSRSRRRRGLDRLDAASHRGLEDLARDAFDLPPSNPDGPADSEEI